jgi:archaellum component FlaC
MPVSIEVGIFTLIGSVLVLESCRFLLKKYVFKIHFVTTENFRKFQVENRELHDEHFVKEKAYKEYNDKIAKEFCDYITRADNDLEEFKAECRNCQKILPEKYASCQALQREIDRLEKIHRDDVNGLYNTMKGGFEGIGRRIDNLIAKVKDEG